ncbi:GNAT family N-acetyltransferase [Bacillus thermotolerans]|uniref:Acetyltransferase n=1 Tax=Bacillus thermotolerans TaxID=1221996 RepID=A0A0F5HW88_BACTR|nr:GNAT family protein [Bacillus thermotolerans]KKB37335.1 Acetyltransferase [Bacillus thermotolerans]
MINLISFTEKDIIGLLEEVDSERLMAQWSGRAYQYPLTEEHLKEYMRIERAKGSYILKASDELTGETVGHIALREIDYVHELGRISYVLVYKKQRGRGIAKQLIEQILQLAFDELQLNRVSLGVFEFNKAAISCYEKFGFKKEGVQRQTCKVDGEYWDNIEMSLLKSEWEAWKDSIQEEVSQ